MPDRDSKLEALVKQKKIVSSVAAVGQYSKTEEAKNEKCIDQFESYRDSWEINRSVSVSTDPTRL